MTNYPTALERPTPAVIRIRWSDGQAQDVTAQQLRDHCPCATCREKHAAPPRSGGLLPILSVTEAKPLEVEAMRPVGNYAYAISFSDGHKNGIFTFELLRDQRPYPADTRRVV